MRTTLQNTQVELTPFTYTFHINTPEDVARMQALLEHPAVGAYLFGSSEKGKVESARINLQPSQDVEQLKPVYATELEQWIAHSLRGPDANARLLAAAPKLLAALVKIEDSSPTPTESDEDLVERIKKIARAAVAKAEGRK